MNIQERGDAMLTAYVNKDFETVEKLWTEIQMGDDLESTKALHGYQNQSIAGLQVGVAVARAVQTLAETGYFD